MNIEVSYLAAFLVGLLGGVHCVGMCGGIVGALCLGLEHDENKTARQSFVKTFPFLLSYNTGRIISYTLAGVLMGGVGWLGSHLFTIYSIQQTLEIIAATFMLALGLYIAGWWKGLAKLNSGAVSLFGKDLNP